MTRGIFATAVIKSDVKWVALNLATEETGKYTATMAENIWLVQRLAELKITDQVFNVCKTTDVVNEGVSVGQNPVSVSAMLSLPSKVQVSPSFIPSPKTGFHPHPPLPISLLFLSSDHEDKI